MDETHAMPEAPRYSRPLIVGLICGLLFLVAPATIIGLSETRSPGYGLWSQMLKTPEELAAAKAREGDRIAAQLESAEAENRQVHEYNAKERAENRFMKLHAKGSFKVTCPNPETWPKLTSEDRQRLRDLLFRKEKKVLLDKPFCP